MIKVDFIEKQTVIKKQIGNISSIKSDINITNFIT